MDDQKDFLEKLKLFKAKLKKRFGVSRVILFGSRVSGNFCEDSDVDLVVVSKKFKGKKFRYRSLGFYEDWGLGYPVDFLCYTPEEFDKLKDQVSIVREAVRNGVEIV